MVGGQAPRMIKPFLEEFPWSLIDLKRAPLWRHTLVVNAQFRCPGDHLEKGIAEPVRSAYDNAEELLADTDFTDDLAKAGEGCPNNNVAVEDRFGQSP